MFEKYEIRCAVVEAGSFTREALGQSPDWAEDYSDATLAVFVRK
jgi:hypothetical protein